MDALSIRESHQLEAGDYLDLNIHVRCMVRNKRWGSAVCHCGGAHDTAVHDNHDEFLEVLTYAFADEQVNCVCCELRGDSTEWHHTWQHDKGVWRDHPQNPPLPSPLYHLSRPWSKHSRLTPHPMHYYRPASSLPDTVYSGSRQLPNKYSDGSLAGLWDSKTDDLETSFVEGLDKATQLSDEVVSLKDWIKEYKISFGLCTRPRNELRRIAFIDYQLDGLFGRYAAEIEDPTKLQGLYHSSSLPDPEYAGPGQMEWFSLHFESALRERMLSSDVEEVERLHAVHQECNTAPGFANRITIQQTAVHMAWNIYACYIQWWEYHRRYKNISGYAKFRKLIEAERAYFGMWPNNATSEVGSQTTTADTTKGKEVVVAMADHSCAASVIRELKTSKNALPQTHAGKRKAIPSWWVLALKEQGHSAVVLRRELGHVAKHGFDRRHRKDEGAYGIHESAATYDLAEIARDDLSAQYHGQAFIDASEKRGCLCPIALRSWKRWFSSQAEDLKAIIHEVVDWCISERDIEPISRDAAIARFK